VHPGKRTAKREPSRYDFQRFELLIDLLRDSSTKGRLCTSIENMVPAINALLSRPEEVRELLDREPWLWFTLDTAHAMAGPEGDLAWYLEVCRDRIANIHLSCTRDGVTHLPLNRDPEMGQFLDMVAESGYAGLITLEIEDMNFSHTLGMEEKITFLSRELHFIRESLQ
jgi:sugar phosphate isomerase/epimerase